MIINHQPSIMYARDIKWNIVNVAMVVLTIVLFPVSRKLSTVDHPCRITGFDVLPRFVCHSECTTETVPTGSPLCDVLARETEGRSAQACYKRRWGGSINDSEWFPEETFDPSTFDYHEIEDLKHKWICPTDGEICDGGRRMMEPHAKCHMYCPMAYNVTVSYLLKDSELPISMTRDLSTNSERFQKYLENYIVGSEATCRVYDNGRRVHFFDDPLTKSSTILVWSVFSLSLIMTIGTSVMAIRECVAIKRRSERSTYPPLIPGTGTRAATSDQT